MVFLRRQIFCAEQLNTVLNHSLIVVRRNAGGQPVSIRTRVILTQCVQIAAVAELNVIGGCVGIGSHAKVCKLAGIGVIALILVQAADFLHADIVVGVGEDFITRRIVALDGRVCTVKFQSAQPPGEGAVINAAAIGVGRDSFFAVNSAGDHGGELIVGDRWLLVRMDAGAFRLIFWHSSQYLCSSILHNHALVDAYPISLCKRGNSRHTKTDKQFTAPVYASKVIDSMVPALAKFNAWLYVSFPSRTIFFVSSRDALAIIARSVMTTPAGYPPKLPISAHRIL